MTQNDSRPSLTRAALVARFLPLALTIACSASLATPVTPTPQAAAIQSAPTPGRATSITATDLRSVNATSTLDAVHQLRPDFLRTSPRADRNATGPAVYVNGMFVGDVSWLAWIQIAEVQDITFMHPTEARFRFGPTCPCGGGIVAVQTVGQGTP